MFNKLFVIVGFVVAVPFLAQAGNYGRAGCGLGSMLFESDGSFHQVLAATTNGTFGSQTFGISSGTSNCTADGVALVDKEKEMFVAMNYESLVQEMAQGGGETLATFGSLMGCSESGIPTFAKFVQQNYVSSFGKTESALELIDVVGQQMEADKSVSVACSL